MLSDVPIQPSDFERCLSAIPTANPKAIPVPGQRAGQSRVNASRASKLHRLSSCSFSHPAACCKRLTLWPTYTSVSRCFQRTQPLLSASLRRLHIGYDLCCCCLSIKLNKVLSLLQCQPQHSQYPQLKSLPAFRASAHATCVTSGRWAKILIRVRGGIFIMI